MGINSNRILVTGGCGFIGKNFINFMIRQGFNKFRILDNLSVGTIEDLETSLLLCQDFNKIIENNFIKYKLYNKDTDNNTFIELYIGDIRNIKDCLECTENVSAVVHLAAQSGVPTSVENPILDCEINVVGTLNMLEACRINKVDKFIFASSSAPLGEVEPPIHENKVPHPVSPYGASKLSGEAYCSAYYKTFGIKTVILRFGNVYGPGSKHKTSVVAKFLKNAIEGLPLEIYGDGTQTRDFIFIEDLCKAIYLSLKSLGLNPLSSNISENNVLSRTNGAAGEIFQIATFKETTVAEIAERIKELVEKETGKKITIIHSEKRKGDVKRNFSDISKATQILGFKPEYELSKGLAVTWKNLSLH